MTIRPNLFKASKSLTKFTSANTLDRPIGTTIHPTSLNENKTLGARINLTELAADGMINSFTRSFNPSANGCNNP